MSDLATVLSGAALLVASASGAYGVYNGRRAVRAEAALKEAQAKAVPATTDQAQAEAEQARTEAAALLVKTTQDMIVPLTERLDDMLRQLADERRLRTSAEGDLAKLRGEFDRLVLEKNVVVAKVGSLESDLALSKADRDLLNSRISELETRLAVRDEQLKVLIGQIRELGAQPRIEI